MEPKPRQLPILGIAPFDPSLIKSNLEGGLIFLTPISEINESNTLNRLLPLGYEIDRFNKTPKYGDYLDPYISDKELLGYKVNPSKQYKEFKLENTEKPHIQEDLLGTNLAKFILKDIAKTPLNYGYQTNSKFPQLPLPPLSLPRIKRSLGLNSIFDHDNDLNQTKPEDLPEMALPILEFMEEVQPHIVIGCDRGGRLFGLAMHAAWRQTRDGEPFPTLDGKLHFARISKSEDLSIMQDKVDQIIEMSKQLGTQRGNQLADGEQLRVLFIDDWVIGGGTMRLAQRLMEKHGAQTYFAVMCGEGADATGHEVMNSFVSWHDHPEEIGVNYLSSVQENPDGTIAQEQKAVAVRGLKAIKNRRQIHIAAKALSPVRELEKVA